MPLLETIASGAAKAFGLTSFSRLLDAFFSRTTLLLPSNSTNNSTNNTITDNSSDNVSATKVNNVALGSFHPFLTNYSVFYDNTTSDGMYAPSNAAFAIGTGNFTVECWVFPQNKTDSSQRIMLQGQSGVTALGIDWDNGVLNIPINTSNKISYSWSSVELNKWHHIALVRSGTGANQLKLYINGTEVASGTSSDSISAYPIHIGGINWASDYNFRGYIANFRYSNTARTISTPSSAYSSDANTLLLVNQKFRFLDESSYGHAVIPYGTPSVSPESPFKTRDLYSVSEGASYYFDGTSDYISVSNTTGLADWYTQSQSTIEYYVYPISVTNGSNGNSSVTTHGNASDGAEYWSFGPLNNGTVKFYWWSGAANNALTTTATIAFNQWVHLAFVKNGTSLKVYINGVESVSTTLSTSPQSATGTNVLLGTGQTASFKGYISNFRIVSGSALYTSNFTPPTSPLSNVSGTKLLLKASETNIFDFTRGSNIEFVGNAVASTTVAKNGTSSLRFFGDGSRLKLSHSDTLNFGTGDFTIEYWIYYTSLSGYQTQYTRGYTGGILIQTGNGDGRAQIYAASGTPIAESSSPATNTWIHYAFVRNNGTVTIYKNGTSVATGTATGNVNFYGPAAFGANIVEGSGQTDGFYPVNGYMDNIRVSRFARYTSNFTPSEVEFGT
jgi:hypothetical protein